MGNILESIRLSVFALVCVCLTTTYFAWKILELKLHLLVNRIWIMDTVLQMVHPLHNSFVWSPEFVYQGCSKIEKHFAAPRLVSQRRFVRKCISCLNIYLSQVVWNMSVWLCISGYFLQLIELLDVVSAVTVTKAQIVPSPFGAFSCLFFKRAI